MRRKPLFPPPESQATGRNKRHKGRQSHTVLTVNGRLRLLRVRWYCPQEGSCTRADAWLDEAEATISQGVREMCCRLNQSSTSFAKTSANLARTAHLQINKETLRQLVETEGRQIDVSFGQGRLCVPWTAADCTSPEGPTRVYLGCDGVKVPLVTESEKQKRREAICKKRRPGAPRLPRVKRGSDNAYKEFRVAHFYDQSHQRCSVRATSGNHEAAGRLMKSMARQLRLNEADERIALIDGAPWIRNQIETRRVADAIGLDYYHLRENAQKARRNIYGEDSAEGQAWLEGLMSTVREEGYNAAWEQLVPWRASLRGAKRKSANRLMQYMTERWEMIQYPEFRSRGWQIGSGPTESECKTTTSRIKGRGRRWDSKNAEALMALACLEDSHLWDTYWKD